LRTPRSQSRDRVRGFILCGGVKRSRFVEAGAGGAGLVLSALVVLSVASLGAQAPAAEPRIWQGIFTDAQAARGKETYTTACLRCHAGDLTGVTAPALVGDRFFQSWGGEPIDRLFLKIRDTMPPNFGTVLDTKAKLDIVTFILQSNGFPSGTTELAVGADELVSAQILKKGQQAAVQNFSLVQTVGCLSKGDGSSWTLIRTAEPLSTREDVPSAQALQSAAARPLGGRTFLLLSAVPFEPAAHVGQKMEARGLVYNDPADSRITLTSLKPTGSACAP
jgi:S-disulfanyl-L-cysteine oxidoreductase SoxD